MGRRGEFYLVKLKLIDHPVRPRFSSLIKLLFMIFFSCAGGYTAMAFQVPAPFILGPAAFVSIASLLGFRSEVPYLLKNLSFLIIGLSLGSNISPDILKNAQAWPLSLVGMLGNTIMVTFMGFYLLKWGFKLNHNTAFLSSSPGHLSFVLGIAAEKKYDASLISGIQSIRVLVLTLAVPLIASNYSEGHAYIAKKEAYLLSFTSLLFLGFLGLFFGFILIKTKIPAAYLISGIIASTIGHGFNLTPGLIPEYLAIAAFIILGAFIGTRFGSVELNVLKKSLAGALAFTAMALASSLIWAKLISSLTNLSVLDLTLAFAPGGLETMIALGNIVGQDPAFIAFHHLSRLIFLSFFIPIALNNINK